MALKVKLLEYTPNPEKIVAAAAKLCYSSTSVEEILEDLNENNTEKFLSMLSTYGHESPVEHVAFTFAVEGVSRSLTHQLVRHRIASYSQQSQRYVKLNQFEYVIPTEIEGDPKAKEIFENAMRKSQESYDSLVEILKSKYLVDGMNALAAEKKAIEDARYVFPNACETKIIVTMNVRSLLNFFRHRCCNRAQWEIRGLAEEMHKQVKEVAPALFIHSGPGCIKGFCPEGKMSCGKIGEMRTKYLK